MGARENGPPYRLGIFHRMPSVSDFAVQGKGQMAIYPLENDGEERSDAGRIQFSGRGERRL